MADKEFRIVYKGGTGEIEEKKSRFIAHILPVTSEEEAVQFINGKKKSSGMQDIIVLLLLLVRIMK